MSQPKIDRKVTTKPITKPAEGTNPIRVLHTEIGQPVAPVDLICAALTPGEIPVATLLLRRLPDREIALDLHVSRYAVTHHIRRMCKKAGISETNRILLARGLLGLPGRPILAILWGVDCDRCVPIHGRGCAASYTDAEGKAVCVFCADGLPCPIQMRILKEIRARGKPANGAHAAAHNVHSAISTLRKKPPAGFQPQEEHMTCSVEGCGKKLSHNNRTGVCERHSSLAGPRTKTNGTKVVAPSAGEPASFSGAGRNGVNGKQPAAVPSRVDLLLRAVPTADKVAMLQAWLRAEC